MLRVQDALGKRLGNLTDLMDRYFDADRGGLVAQGSSVRTARGPSRAGSKGAISTVDAAPSTISSAIALPVAGLCLANS